MLSKLKTLALGAVAGLVIGGAASAAEYEWTFQASESAGEPQFILKQEWAKKVETMTNGRIKVDFLPTGAVVPHNQTLDAVGAGILQGKSDDPSYFAGKDPAFAMMGNLVGAWGDPLEFLEWMKYGGGEELYNELVHPYGVHLIGTLVTGVESFPSSKPIRTMDDLKGLKVRAPEGMVYEIFAKAGAAPVNLPGSEVYTGLEKRVIDAADYTVLATNHDMGLHKFAKYPAYPGFHSLPMLDFSINKEIWDNLPADLKVILETSVDLLAYDMALTLKQRDIKAAEQIRQDPSVEMIDMAPEERAKFRNIAKEEWKVWAEKSDLCGKVYNSATEFLTARGLM
ncbi:TRAP transporter substrate-binding protein [Rhodobacteraceae bacterium RKSG542]|uniref:TRAP transporter substrate-binding protein n=1 Tax=Pseudovibrio flavus TaxID=2529854 RepID=UPI0012BC8B0B|nr:TRAP transporter substrate-binding protein [Pseudovibrio flavus]MTI18209.1 TRAP transporter substrate-binding protein [Pseudovibrio flavus]